MIDTGNIETTYNYYCVNSSCKEYVQKKQISKLRKFRDLPEFCEECKEEMKLIGEAFNCVATFDSLSDSQKREVIKKRADQHTEKKMKDSVQHIKSRFGIGEK